MKTTARQINKKPIAMLTLCAAIVATALTQFVTLSESREEITNPKSVATAFEKSYEQEADKDYNDAIDALIDVYNDHPDDYTVNLRLGWLYYKNDESEEALVHYRAAIQAEPESIEARLGYMLPLLALGKYSEVESNAYQVLKKDSNNYYATLRLVIALRLQGKYEIAEKAARQMLDLYPSDVSFMAELALAEAGQGNEKTAQAISWKIRMLDPDNATADYYLGD